MNFTLDFSILRSFLNETFMTTKNGISVFEAILQKFNFPFADQLYFNQKLWQWAALALLIIAGFFVRKISSFIFIQVEKATGRTKNEIDNIVIHSVKKEAGWLATLLFWYIGISEIGFSEGFLTGSNFVLKIIFFFQLISAALSLSKHAEAILKLIFTSVNFHINDTLFPIAARVIKALVIILLPLLALQNLGLNVMSLVAGLGLGGLAFALAAKDTAANLFGSIMILIDRPFTAGDWVVIGGSEGTVTEIGLRSTRIRTFYDSIISIPNSEVANQTVDNMGKRNFRRVKSTLGVTYDTSPEKLEGFMEAIKQIIHAHPNTRKDYYQIVFTGFGPSSLDILLYFFIQVPDWSRELVVKQNIYLDIIRAANELGVEFAFPTSSIHIESHAQEKKKNQEKPIDEMKSIVSSMKEKANPDGVGLYNPIYNK
jgi:MscS family membrane protein